MELIERTRQKSDEFDVDIYLTLSVTTKSKDLVSIVERYQDIKDWLFLQNWMRPVRLAIFSISE